MEICYPAILLSILGLFIAIFITLGGNLYWMAGPVLASPAFIFAFISYRLCKKGHKKMAWIAPLGALLFMMLLAMGV
jgi:hypothetical protein